MMQQTIQQQTGIRKSRTKEDLCGACQYTEQEVEAEKRKARLEIIVYLSMMNAKAKRIIDLKDDDQTLED